MAGEPHAGRGEPLLASGQDPSKDKASKVRRERRALARLWYHPRNLPHFDASLVTQAITYRLSDALPQQVAERLADELTPDDDPRYRRRIEAYLDAGHGCRCLTTPAIAQDLIATWQRFDGERYHLRAWVVMPNHVHVLITMIPGHTLGAIVQSWKSWTGKRIKAITKTVTWQRDYWDRFIRDNAHYAQAVSYIHDNPVKAGLCPAPEAWPWSSASPTTLGEASPCSLKNKQEGEQGLASPGGRSVPTEALGQAIKANLKGLGYGG